MADAEGTSKEPIQANDATQTTAQDGDSTASHPPSESQLEELKAQATAKYAVKDYKAAAELYSRATEVQAEIHGEMSPKNANLLYFYGRCLYHLAVSNSDVLGTRVAGDEQDSGAEKSKPAASTGASSSETKPGVASSSSAPLKKEEPEDPKAPKPFFQFQGDENFELSDEEDGEDGEDAAAPAAEDDFSDAFEVLDMARVLLQRQLEEHKAEKSPDEALRKEIRAVEERLADTYDLQAEISLENEHFPQAATDMKAALALKEALYPFESSLIAEAHYKLSLALEFSSMTQQKDENGEAAEGEPLVADEKMREESAVQMERAVESCKARIQKEEAKADAETDEAAAKKMRVQIQDVKEMTAEMKIRLIDLRKPLVSVSDLVADGNDSAKGLLGSLQGQSSAKQKAIVEEASAKANDLTGLVKRKRKDEPEDAEMESNGKRSKTEDME